MAVQHWSDCAIYNAPAFEPGECDCGAIKPHNGGKYVVDGVGFRKAAAESLSRRVGGDDQLPAIREGKPPHHI